MSAPVLGATDQLATPPVGPAPLVAEAEQGRWGDVWRAISRNRKALVGVLLLLVFVVLAIFPGQIAPDDPIDVEADGALDVLTQRLGADQPARRKPAVRPGKPWGANLPLATSSRSSAGEKLGRIQRVANPLYVSDRPLPEGKRQ